MKKILSLVTLVILCLSVSIPLISVVNAQQDDSWPMFHRDLAHTGYANTEGPSTNQTLWTFPILNNGWVLTSPSVVNDVVYFTSSDRGYHLDTTNNNIYALNAKDGSKIWNYSVPAKIYGAPAVADGMVFFASDDLCNLWIKRNYRRLHMEMRNRQLC